MWMKFYNHIHVLLLQRHLIYGPTTHRKDNLASEDCNVDSYLKYVVNELCHEKRASSLENLSLGFSARSDSTEPL